jgi:hypothetical protein
MRIALIIIVSIALFIGAAAWHGRQLRLERERAGYMHVTFGASDNPQFVEELWRAERVRFWGLTLVLAVAAIATAFALKRHYPLFAIGALLWAPTISFLVFGLVSKLRS